MMKSMSRVVLAVLGLSALLLAPATVQAQLALSDTPLFVTDPYAPNVIISPVYRYDFNESSMKDVPWTDPVQKAAFIKFPWAASPLSVDKYPFRVTPWPNTYHYIRSTPDHPNLLHCDQATGSVTPQGFDGTLWSFPCSESSMYPNSDITLDTDLYHILSGPYATSVAKSDKKVRAFGRPSYFSHELYPWDGGVQSSNAAPAFILNGDTINYSFFANTAPRSGIHTEARYHPAKSRYFRSNSNFLYFSDSLDDNGAVGYQPWPALGGAAFPAYTTTTAAKTPYFSPLDTSLGTIDLGVRNSYIVMFSSGSVSGGNTDSYDANNWGAGAYVGQYWKKTGTSVIEKNSYYGYCWLKDGGGTHSTNTVNFGCDQTMGDAEKLQFATWFTYWRSAGFTARGMMGQLFDRLHQKGLLNKFRFAISYNSGGPDLDPDSTTDYSPDAVVKVTPFFSIDNANAKPANAGRTTGVDALLTSLRAIIYNSGGAVSLLDGDKVSFNNAWDHNVTNAVLSDEEHSYTDANGFVAGCRRNYEILLTPDYTRLAYSTLTAPQTIKSGENNLENNADSSEAVRFPDFVTGNKNMWSDVGAYGYITDLIDLPDNVPSLADDPATHQHVVRYIIGPSLPPTANFPSGISYSDVLTKAAALSTTNAWPAKPADSKVELDDTYDDLWHMALNSYGKFLPSDNVTTAVDNLFSTFKDILSRTVSGTAVAAGTSSLQNGGTIYQASVETDWRGHLKAYQVTSETVTINGASTTRLVLDYSSPLWDFAEKVSAITPTNRKIMTYLGGVGVPFRWANIGTSAQDVFKLDKPASVTSANEYGERVVNYLRGDGTCEDVVDGSNTRTCADSSSGAIYSFRHRNADRSVTGNYSSSLPLGRNLLGDIANSNPWIVTPPAIGYSEVDYPGYNDHRVDTASRPNVLYFGANDGMLHALVAENKTVAGTTYTAGQELFAYVPSFIHTNMKDLANKDYLHKYTVDGSPFAADVMLDGVWKTVLAGGVNKGGRGYYLLNITNPTSVNESSESASDASRLVRWEFTNASDSDLLYTFNLPAAFPNGQARQLVRLNNDKWALIVGNGYPGDLNESGTSACLFIIYLTGPTGSNASWTSGTDYRKICVGQNDYSAEVVGGPPGGGLNLNGLSTPTPVDLNGDGKVDTVYAGDLNGNLWRFDLSSTLPANWQVAYSGTPLFVALNSAGTRQPIIAPPEVITHTVGDVQGRMVVFGTGKFLEPSDATSTSTQTIYGVWDRDNSSFVNLRRTHLVAQVMDTPTAGASITYRDQTNPSTPSFCTLNTLEMCSGNNKQFGWYWDMPEIGERQTGKASLVGETIFFNTFYPYTQSVTVDGVTTTTLDPCRYGGDGYLMGLNAIYGYMESDFAAFDTNLDGVIDDSDTKAAGIKIGAAMGGTTFVRGVGDRKVGIYSPTNLNNASSRITTTTGNSGTTGRVSWYELLD